MEKILKVFITFFIMFISIGCSNKVINDRILYSWQFNLCPYKTFLTPGHTGAEWIYEQYEYDQYYDIDKFYNLVRE